MSIQSLHRAFDILELIASHNAPVPLKTISEQTGLSVSTVHNLIKTMESRGYIQHVGGRGGFTLGNELAELAAVVPTHLQITELIRPFVVRLYEQSERESTYFSTIRKDLISTQIYIPCSYALSVSLGADTLDKLYCSAQGKVFLAYMTDNHLDKYLRNHELLRTGPNTIIDADRLKEELHRIRQRQYALNLEESELGACGIAAPVLHEQGHIIGVLAIGLPSVRMREKQERLIRVVQEIAAEAGDKLAGENRSQ